MVIAPDVDTVAGVSQELAPPVPVIDQFGEPDGATAPVGPVTVRVNTAVPP